MHAADAARETRKSPAVALRGEESGFGILNLGFDKIIIGDNMDKRELGIKYGELSNILSDIWRSL